MSAGDSRWGLPPDGHPDQLRWNARYASGCVPSFRPHPLAVQALAMDLPDRQRLMRRRLLARRQ